MQPRNKEGNASFTRKFVYPLVINDRNPLTRVTCLFCGATYILPSDSVSGWEREHRRSCKTAEDQNAADCPVTVLSGYR